MVQLAGADLGRAGLEDLDRLGQPPGQQRAHEHRQHDAHHHQQAGPPGGGPERLERLLQRLLDEDDPAQRRDRRVRGEDLAALGIAGDRHLGAAGGQRGLHLGEIRQRGLLQHEADVGMRDEGPVAIDRVGQTRLADLDLGDDLPDELQIDLGHRHAAAALRHGDGHVRLGLLAEVHRAEVRAAGLGLAELRVLRIVDPAVDHVHGQPRHAQALETLGVEMAQLGDGQQLLQEPDGVHAALLGGGRRRDQLGGWVVQPSWRSISFTKLSML